MASAWVLAARVHGLDHVEADRGPGAALELLGGLLPGIGEHGASASGGLTDGAWAVFEGQGPPIEAALAWAALPAAVGIARGSVHFLYDVPQGSAARLAQALATAVRLREVAVPSALLEGVALPVGVGAFAAPTPLGPTGLDLTLVRDFREIARHGRTATLTGG